MLHFAIQAQVMPDAFSPTHAKLWEDAMPTTPGEFGSPRDAIRHWLSRTNGGEGHKSFVGGERPEHDVDENRPRKDQHPTDHNSGNRKVAQQETGFGFGQDRTPEVNAMPIDVGYRGRARSVDKPGQTIPSRLGLQAPFRLLGGEGRSGDLQGHDRHHTKKRRISVSSETTYLQPATAPGKAESESDNRSRARHHHHRLAMENIDGNDLTSSTMSSSSDSVTDCLPKKPARTYERRPRHKTRGDRYEKKQTRARAKTKAKNAAETGEKRKRKAKSGAVPTHNFTATNVMQDRLTLRPVRKVGLFKKGRASSPVRRRGLPDLSFSELTFLSTRRDRDRENEEEVNRNKRGRKGKAADAEDEISRFFTTARLHTAESDGEIHQSRLQGQGVVKDSIYGTSKKKRRASSVNSSALPESIAAADVPGKPFLGFGNRGARPLSPAYVHEHSSGTSAAKSPVRVLNESTVRASSHFTWSRRGIASHGSGNHGPVDYMDSDPLRKGDILASGEPVLGADELNPSGPTICRCQRHPDGKSTQESPKGNGSRTDAAIAASGESLNLAEQGRSYLRDTHEDNPEGPNDEEQPVANVSGNKQAARLRGMDVSDSGRAAPKNPPSPVGENMGTLEEGLEVFELGIDRLLLECATNAAETAYGQDWHNQPTASEEQDTPSPLQKRRIDHPSVKIMRPEEQMATCDRFPRSWDIINAVVSNQATAAGRTLDCSVAPESGLAPHRNHWDGVYRRTMAMDSTEGYLTVPQGVRKFDRIEWQGAGRGNGSRTPDRGRPITGRSDALIHKGNLSTVRGCWPLAYDYNLAGPSIEPISHASLYAAQDNDRDYELQPPREGRNQGQPVDNNLNEFEGDVECCGSPSESVTMVQDARFFGELGFSDSYGKMEGADILLSQSPPINASKLEQVQTGGYPRHRFVGLESSTGLSSSSFPKLGSLSTLFSKRTADQKTANSPPMQGFWQPHKLY